MEINSNPQPSSGTGTGNLSSAQRPGEYLRQLRSIQRRELSEVARELNMPERQLIALEADDYKSLPEPAFIKGYLRAYARLLGTDAGNLIHRFNEIYTSDTGLPTNHALENSPLKALGRLQRGRRPRLGWLKWAVGALVIIAILWLLYAGFKAWRNSQPVQPVSAEVAALDVTTAPTVLPVPTAIASTDDRLTLNFSNPVNVSIHDATGKNLASGRQTQPLTLTGQSPFSIRLEDAAAVSLSFNEEQISLSPYTVNGKAEFRLSR
jgi:cytoskeletal protein RodZ